jgi:hypothetical protein
MTASTSAPAPIATAAYANKRTIIDALSAQSGPGLALDGIQVLYAYEEAQTTERCVYAGGVTFDRSEGPVDGTSVLYEEADGLSLYVRVLARGAGRSVRAAESEAERIGDVIAGLLAGVAGPNTYTRIVSGAGDYSQTDDEAIIILGLRLLTNCYV